MAINKQVSCLQFSATTTSGATPINLGGVKRVTLKTIAQDVYIDFDQPIATTTAFRLSSANTSDTTIEVNQGLINNLYIQAVTGTTTVYIISIVG